MSRSDRAIGIALGILVGIAALILFVFFGSSGSIDAPSLNTGSQAPVEKPADSR
jgi:hypothetical protein